MVTMENEIQGTISVRFLDKVYNIPNDAITFLRCRDEVSNGFTKLLQESSKLIEKYRNYGTDKFFGYGESDINHLKDVMRQLVDGVVKKLIDSGIYDINEAEMVQRFSVFEDIVELEKRVVINATIEGQKIVNAKNAGLSYAYRSAASNITGSGVRLYTSSLTSLMMHSAIENSILKSQAKKADQEYEKALREINSQSSSAFERMCKDILYNDFFPNLTKLFIDFHNDLLKNYLLELTQHGKFSIDNIEQYNENKSSTMLENMKHATDKRALLIQAYEMCPFNIEVYEKMIELGFFDVETMKDAKKIFKVSELSGLLEEKIKNNLKKPDVIKDYITVLADYKGVNETDILKTFYQSTISRIKNDYHELFLLCADSKRLDKWIMEKINSDMDKVVTTSEDDARNKVNSWIQRNVEDSEFAELSNMGLMTIEDVRMKDSTMTTLEEVKTEYANTMVSRIMDYIKEAKVRKVAYEEAYDKFNAELKKKNDALDSKMAELKQQGMFAFSKKKEIKAEIEQLQRDLDDFRRTEPTKLKEAYYGMYA